MAEYSCTRVRVHVGAEEAQAVPSTIDILIDTNRARRGEERGARGAGGRQVPGRRRRRRGGRARGAWSTRNAGTAPVKWI
jgi:hypothetical protein